MLPMEENIISHRDLLLFNQQRPEPPARIPMEEEPSIVQVIPIGSSTLQAMEIYGRSIL
jgi:hypothetical protein